MASANFKLKPNNTVLGIHAHVTCSYYFCRCCYFFLLDNTKEYTLIYMCIKHDEGGFLLWWKVNRLKTIMWYDCCQLNPIHLVVILDQHLKQHTETIVKSILCFAYRLFSAVSRFKKMVFWKDKCLIGLITFNFK